MKQNNIKNAIEFYLKATSLKEKLRSGWDDQHWAVKTERRESIAEHVYGTCILALALTSEHDFKIDVSKVLKMLVLHEIGEVIIGDVTPFDNITTEEKMNREHLAMSSVLGDLIKKEEYLSLLLEFDERKTNEAKFAYMIDKIEADIQSKVYEDKGFQRSLDDQKGNVVYNSPIIEKMVKRGAKTAFDIWYEWDKEKFEESTEFQKVLEYVKNNNTNIKK